MAIHRSRTSLAGKRREQPIGVFDSGIGGLTVLRQLHRTLPHEDLVYLGDTARVPYGTKSPATVVRFACEDMAFLLSHQVKAVVVACNTVSAWALPTLERRFHVPILGVILPGVRAAMAASRNHRIGVIGTSATIRSLAYPRTIATCDKSARVFTNPCPLLVPLVEEGWMDHFATRAILMEYLKPLLQKQIDTLVLGCTHYPLLKSAIQRIVGPAVTLVDSAESCAVYARRHLEELDLLSSGRRRAGKIRPFVTDEVERFEETCDRFLGFRTHPPRKIDLQPFTP